VNLALEKDLLKLFLPEGLLDLFDIEKIEQGIENFADVTVTQITQPFF